MSKAATLDQKALGDATNEVATALGKSARLTSIDALRGFVMIIMLLDHVRETFFLHHQVSDPMNALETEPLLFLTRIASMICAPVFVALTGLSAWLFGQKHSKAEVSEFLIKRGLFLILIEITIIGFAWSGNIIPKTFWLQVIWAIGISMIFLAALIHLPRKAQITIGIVILLGHNFLDGIRLTQDSPFFVLWAIFHQRDIIHLPFGLIAKTTYPILPWIAVMLLGYNFGPLFANEVSPSKRKKILTQIGLGLILFFLLVRGLNFYGDKPWVAYDTFTRSLMSFFALTKYPPSLLFLASSLGVGCLLLSAFESENEKLGLKQLAILGGAPMFFYILHLLTLKALYTLCVAIWGLNQGKYFGASSIFEIWIIWLAMIVPLYWPSNWYSEFKKKRRDIAILRYL